jgi:hypothetical protein
VVNVGGNNIDVPILSSGCWASLEIDDIRGSQKLVAARLRQPIVLSVRERSHPGLNSTAARPDERERTVGPRAPVGTAYRGGDETNRIGLCPRASTRSLRLDPKRCCGRRSHLENDVRHRLQDMLVEFFRLDERAAADLHERQFASVVFGTPRAPARACLRRC